MTDQAASAETTSALQENIKSKGSNAYYFAHANTANGPKWDGKAEPKLMARMSSENLEPRKCSGFEYHKSNITAYAFSDEGKMVKLYITMDGIGEKCTEEDISLDFTETSFCLVVNNYKDVPQCLSFGKLAGPISKASFKLKDDQLLLRLTKSTDMDWHTINDKGTPDHEVV